MIIVVDTNIIFSAILNSDGLIGDILFNSYERFEFFSCAYLRHELRTHWDKLLKISKLSDYQLQISYDLVLSKLTLINEEIFPAGV